MSRIYISTDWNSNYFSCFIIKYWITFTYFWKAIILYIIYERFQYIYFFYVKKYIFILKFYLIKTALILLTPLLLASSFLILNFHILLESSTWGPQQSSLE